MAHDPPTLTSPAPRRRPAPATAWSHPAVPAATGGYTTGGTCSQGCSRCRLHGCARVLARAPRQRLPRPWMQPPWNSTHSGHMRGLGTFCRTSESMRGRCGDGAVRAWWQWDAAGGGTCWLWGARTLPAPTPPPSQQRPLPRLQLLSACTFNLQGDAQSVLDAIDAFSEFYPMWVLQQARAARCQPAALHCTLLPGPASAPPADCQALCRPPLPPPPPQVQNRAREGAPL